MTTIQTGATTETISTPITPADGTGLLIIFSNDLNAYKAKYGITESAVSLNGFIDELYCFAKLKKSLAEAPAIDFLPTDTRDERTAKAIAYEWSPTNPRMELEVWTRRNPGTAQVITPWNLVGSTSLLNVAGYPWRRYRLLDLLSDNLGRKFGPNGQLAVSLRDVGFGVIKSPEDVITVDGAFTQEPVIFTPTNPNVQYNNYNYLFGTVRVTLMEPNEFRNSFNITNNSATQTVYLDYSPNVSTTVFTQALTPGQNHVGAAGYKGIVTVVASAGNSRVTAREAMY